jgi:hypothetical protein
MVDERGQELVAKESAPALPPRAAVIPPAQPAAAPANTTPPPREIGGPKGLEPTRYGDWERAGRCIDF